MCVRSTRRRTPLVYYRCRMLKDLFLLARRRTGSEASYREMQKLIAEQSVSELNARGVDVAIGSMLEIAAGHGGYTQVFEKISPDLVATDIKKLETFRRDLAHVAFEQSDASKPFPFADGRFDFIYCASLIEHLEDRSNLYRECRRLLAPGGTALFSFPPFWSLTLVGGHQYKPFHLFGEKVAVAVARRRGEDVRSYSDNDVHGGLHPLTIKQVTKELENHGWRVTHRWARMWPVNTARFPGIIADLLTWHVCFLATPDT